MGQSHSTSSSSPRPITGARKHRVSRQDSLLETPAPRNTEVSGDASNCHSEETVIPIQELRPAPPPNRRPSYIPAVIFSPHDIRTPTHQTTASGRRRSLPGVRRAPRLLVAHPPILHDEEPDNDQGNDNGNSDADGDLQSICSSSHTPQIDRPKTPLTDRPPTPRADASDSEDEEPPISPLSPKQTPSSLPTPPRLIQDHLDTSPGIVVKRYFTRYPRCCNALWLDQCYLSTSTSSPSPSSSFSSSSHLEDAILPSPAQAICPRCLHRARLTAHRLATKTGCFDPDTEAASRAANRRASPRLRGIAFKYDLVEAAWVLEQLRRWKAAAAAVRRVCDQQVAVDDQQIFVDEESKTGMGVGVGVGVSAEGGAGAEEREGEGEVDAGLFLIGDDEDEDEDFDAEEDGSVSLERKVKDREGMDVWTTERIETLF
ncbi:hypothetical protein KC318_g16722 [Hortaea werneckii]|nr:hypothetical protein KC334_g16756 [Hortaea werneckii]KAI6926443.1 hypothetical protein KC355_g16746 [Hortaea werneckii]KAI7650046.1 hypothetical protein KC318_g16722 [Hortaea werneckii]